VQQDKETVKLEEIFDEDLHKMLLAVQNLIEYLNNKYGFDKTIEEEVNYMTKTLYDPLVEQRGEKRGEIKGRQNAILELLQERFNPPIQVIEDIKGKLSQVTSLDTINGLFKEAIRCAELESFTDKL
jgi:hypothetical protein